MRREPERVARLQANGKLFLDKARGARINVGGLGLCGDAGDLGDFITHRAAGRTAAARGYNGLPIGRPAFPSNRPGFALLHLVGHTTEQTRGRRPATKEALAQLQKEGVSFATRPS